MIARADQFHNDYAPDHSTALVQAFLFAPLQHIFGSLRLLAFPKAKFAFEREEIFECEVSAYVHLRYHHTTYLKTSTLHFYPSNYRATPRTISFQ
jgi:hypothetical protein